ncbi:hypothetical protein Tco_1076771 [Tanacetum coccineum]
MRVLLLELIFVLPGEFRTLPGIPPDLIIQNTTLFQLFDFLVHNLNRFLEGMELVVDLNLIQRNDECFVRQTLLQVAMPASMSGHRFELMVITMAPTLRGLARSFLLRASTATFAFTRMYGRVSGSSSHELSVVESCKLSSSPSASL